MTRDVTAGVFGLLLIVGLSACGGPSPTAPTAQHSYRVQQHPMPTQQPSGVTQHDDPQTYNDPRYRPRGSTIYMRGQPIIRETYPIRRRDWDTPHLRGVPFLHGAYDSPYPRPGAERDRQRQFDYIRVRLTAVENRIRQLQEIYGYTSRESMRYTIWTELKQLMAERTELRARLRGSIYRTDN